MLITSVNNDRVKELVRLKEKKYRDKCGLFFIEGYDIVSEAYKNGVIKELYVLDGIDCSMDVPITYVSMDVMKKISDMESVSEYYAVCYKKEELEIRNRLIMLDGIQDPGNLGTIIRSAVAFNFDTIILSSNCVDIYNSKVIRASQGLLFNVNIIVGDLEKVIPLLKEEGYQIYGTKVTNGKNVKSIAKKSLFAIIMGNEGNGISDLVSDLCDEFIYIEMNENCESLNVGVAASILMYELGSK